MTREPFTRLQFVRFLLCWPLYICLFLLVCEALLSAATTWLVIKVGRDVANGNFFVMDLVWILLVQCASYAAGAISWVFAERAGTIAAQTGQKVAGVVENMSFLEMPDGGRMELFGSGGGAVLAERLSATVGTDVPLLGQIPLDILLREGGDAGVPLVLGRPETPAAVALLDIAGKLAAVPRGLRGMSLGLQPR